MLVKYEAVFTQFATIIITPQLCYSRIITQDFV